MTTTPFAISRFAPADKPIARYRADRGWVELERSEPPIEPMWESILGGLILVAFCVVGTFIAYHLPEWGV